MATSPFDNWLLRQEFGKSQRIGGHSPYRRQLAFEAFEDRRLLATVTVSNLNDVVNGDVSSIADLIANHGGDGISLREALTASSSTSAANPDIIDFSVTGTIQLTTAGTDHLLVDTFVNILGPGASLLAIRAHDPDENEDGDGRRVFYISNNSGGLLNVRISGLTLTNGDPDIDLPDGAGGGAIYNDENLTLIDCVVHDNFAQDGGAIMVAAGSLTVRRTEITNNRASNAGGGIWSFGWPVTIEDSTISGNLAQEHGGGIYHYLGSSLTVSGTTISGNVADDDTDGLGRGGGVFKAGGGMSITSSTISGNTSGEDGGGIFSDTSSTIAIAHSTITANNVTGGSGRDGGGIYSNETANLNHTIVAGNFKGGSALNDVFGSFSAASSLIGDRGSASVTNVSNLSIVGTSGSPINALLGSLADNGGPTKTHALLVGSPAIDAGNVLAVAGSDGIPLLDQRGTGFARILDGDNNAVARIDMGAVEIAPPGPELPGDYNLNGVVDAADYVYWRKTFGATVPRYQGADGDGDTTIGHGDYILWIEDFGETTPGVGGASDSAAALAVVSPEDENLLDASNLRLLSDFWQPATFVGLEDSAAAPDAPFIRGRELTWTTHGERLSDLLLALDASLDSADEEPLDDHLFESWEHDPYAASSATDTFFENVGQGPSIRIAQTFIGSDRRSLGV